MDELLKDIKVLDELMKMLKENYSYSSALKWQNTRTLTTLLNVEALIREKKSTVAQFEREYANDN